MSFKRDNMLSSCRTLPQPAGVSRRREKPAVLIRRARCARSCRSRRRRRRQAHSMRGGTRRHAGGLLPGRRARVTEAVVDARDFTALPRKANCRRIGQADSGVACRPASCVNVL